MALKTNTRQAYADKTWVPPCLCLGKLACYIMKWFLLDFLLIIRLEGILLN